MKGSRIVLGIVLSIIASACSMGGGTLGTGINSYGSNSDATALNFSLDGILKDANGRIVNNGSISVFTSHGEERAISNKKGRYIIPLTLKSGEEVKIVVRQGAESWSCQTFISPEGQDFVRFDLKLGSGGRLQCGSSGR